LLTTTPGLYYAMNVVWCW